VDPRLFEISIRHLLYHAGGWDAGRGSDPTGRFREAAATLKVPLPASAETIIRYMIGRPLDFDPGTQHAYSNFGYCLLGRVIEKVSGRSYEDYVKEHLIKPIAITNMRIGRTLREQRFPGEVCYYSAPGAPMARSALSDSSLAAIVCMPNGLSYAALFNSIPASISELNPFFAELDRTIVQIVEKVTEWPANDLFDQHR